MVVLMGRLVGLGGKSICEVQERLGRGREMRWGRQGIRSLCTGIDMSRNQSVLCYSSGVAFTVAYPVGEREW